MLKTRVIPCLLVNNGRLVKTVRFKQPAYVGDPVNAIKIRCNLPERKLERHSIKINQSLCVGCGLCVDACKITLKGEPAMSLKDGLAYVNETRCIGCGACATTCPAECIRVVKIYDKKRVAGQASDVVILP